jgi:hypothetical protein
MPGPWVLESKGPVAAKFAGAPAKCASLSEEYRRIAAEVGCPVFDAGSVIGSSVVDGIHLDDDQRLRTRPAPSRRDRPQRAAASLDGLCPHISGTSMIDPSRCGGLAAPSMAVSHDKNAVIDSGAPR